MEKECYKCNKVKKVYATNMMGTICKECHRIIHPLRTKLWHEVDIMLDNEDYDISGELLDKVFIMLDKNPYLTEVEKKELGE